MFLRIDTLQPLTEEWARKASKEGGWSSNSIAITEYWFKQGLRPFSLTRDLKWGIPVPLKEMKDKVLYVWFDAPIGYPSITANYTDDWEQWWKNPEQVSLYQFMGKDNVRFHTVIFPSCLIGTKEPWTKLQQISTTEYLQYEGGKFSKSRNIGVFGDKAGEIGVAPSVWRYYLISNRPESSDSQFSWSEFIARNNGELLNNLGNFVNRVLTFVSKKYESNLPQQDDRPLEGRFKSFVDDINKLLGTYAENMEAAKLRVGLSTMMAISARGNLFLVEIGLDNKLFNDKRGECDVAVSVAVNLIYLLAALVHPFMPSTADEILVQLDAPAPALPAAGEWTAKALLPGHKIGKPKHLFRRIEDNMEEVWRRQFGGSDADEAAPPPISKSKAAKLAKQARKEAAASAGAQPGSSTSASSSTPLAAEPTQTPEIIELQKKIDEQGQAVREAKAASKAPAATDEAKSKAEAEVQTLLKLK